MDNKIFMQKIFTILLTFLLNNTFGQFPVDTLQGVHAFINGYHVIPSYFYTTKGHTIGMGYINHFSSDGKAGPIEIVRIDFTEQKFEKKTIPEILSGVDVFWKSIIDAKGNIYLSGNVPQRTIEQLNLEDSIAYHILGNAFTTGNALAYSMAEGQDGKIYFGGSSGGTFYSSYDPLTKNWNKGPVLDPDHAYVLSITGDAQFIYAQTGQQNAIRLWAIKKSNGQKKLLASIKNTTRFNFATYREGIYVSMNTDTLKGVFQLKNGNMVRVPALPVSMTAMNYEDRNGNVLQQISSWYDPVTNDLNYGWKNNLNRKIHIPSSEYQTDIRKLFSFPGDNRYLYFVGDYYGNYYQYDIAQKRTTLLGNTGMNVYSFLAFNDSILYMGGYPSGYLMVWNRHQPWTANRFINGKFITPNEPEANPHLLIHWKSEGTPPAGFHHTLKIVFDMKGNIVGAGNVIRIGHAASVGVYNPYNQTLYGIDYSFLNYTTFSDMILWKNQIIFSVKSTGKNFLWFYDPEKNRMTDSINLGYDDYGKLYIEKNLLTGIAQDRIYQFDLNKKVLIYNFSFPQNTIAQSFQLSYGKKLVHSKLPLPKELSAFYLFPYNEMVEINGVIYMIKGKNIFTVKENLFK